MSRHRQSTARPRASVSAPPNPGHRSVALLIGLGIALAAGGYVAAFEVALDASPATFRWSSGIVLFTMAFGPRLPRWLARRLMSLARGRPGPDGRAALPLEIPTDRHHLEWTVVAIVGLLAGVAVLALPLMLDGAQRLHVWALREFLWTGRTLGVLDVLTMLVAAPPFVILGMLAHCTHRLGADNRRWRPQVAVFLLGGAGLGLWLDTLFLLRPDGHALVLRSAAVPLLLAGMLAVWRSGARRRVRSPRPAKPILAEPEGGNHWIVVLRLAIAVVTVTLTSAMLVWVYVVDALDMALGGWRTFSGGALLISTSLGLAFAFRAGRASSSHGVGAFGVRCALAGGALAAGMAVFNLVTRASYPAFLHSPAIWLLWGWGACLPMAVLGWALGGGVLAFLSRSPDDSEAGAILLQMLLGAAGCASLAVAFTLLERVGSYPTLVAMALALLAMGGTLVIHDPCAGHGAQRLRLAGVFGGVVVMTFLMPEAGRHWLGHQQRPRGRMWESWWVTHDVTSGAPATAAGSPLAGADGLVDWYRVRPDCRVGVISMFGDVHLQLPASFSGRVDQWAVLAGGGGAGDAPAPTEERPALQALRATRERYDLVIVALEDASPEFACHLLGEGLIERAWARLAPDAALICVVPAGADSASAVRAGLAAPTVQRADPAVEIVNVHVGGRVCLGVRAERGVGRGDRAMDWIQRAGREAQPPARGAVATGR